MDALQDSQITPDQTLLAVMLTGTTTDYIIHGVFALKLPRLCYGGPLSSKTFLGSSRTRLEEESVLLVVRMRPSKENYIALVSSGSVTFLKARLPPPLPKMIACQ